MARAATKAATPASKPRPTAKPKPKAKAPAKAAPKPKAKVAPAPKDTVKKGATTVKSAPKAVQKSAGIKTAVRSVRSHRVEDPVPVRKPAPKKAFEPKREPIAAPLAPPPVASTSGNVSAAGAVLPETSTALRDALVSRGGLSQIAGKKLWADVRDRAVYVAVTGAFPSHLRPETLTILREATTYSKEPTSIDGESGGVALRPEYRQALDVDSAPLLLKVAEFVRAGWKLAPVRDEKARRPYGRIWLFKPVSVYSAQRCTIHASGAAQAEWI